MLEYFTFVLTFSMIWAMSVWIISIAAGEKAGSDKLLDVLYVVDSAKHKLSQYYN